ELQRSAELHHAAHFHRYHPGDRRDVAGSRTHSQARARSHPQRESALQGACDRHLPLELHRHHLCVHLRLRFRRPLPRHQDVPARIRPLPLLTCKHTLLMPLSVNSKKAHTSSEVIPMVATSGVWKKKCDTLRTRRNSLFAAYTKDPQNISLAREIKALDDEIAD